MFVLNRKNTMLFTNQEKIKIKSHYQTVQIAYKADLFEMLKTILAESEQVTDVKDLEQLIAADASHLFYQTLQVLRKCGSVALFENGQMVQEAMLQRWFPIFIHYLGPQQNITAALEVMNSSSFEVTASLKSAYPELQQYLLELGFSEGESSHSILVTTKEAFAEKNRLTLTLSFDDYGICGYSGKPENWQTHKKNEFSNKQSLLYKVGPAYIGIYLIKMLLEQNKNYFIIDQSITFCELDIYPEQFYQTLPFINEKAEVENTKHILRKIEALESFLEKKDSPIRVSNEKSEWGKAFQMGFSTIGLESSTAQFVYCSPTFEDSHYIGIQKGLKYFLEEATKASWLVTTSNQYLVDKALFVLKEVDEPFVMYRLSDDYLSKLLVVNAYFGGNSDEIAVYLKRYTHSASFEVLIQDRKSGKIFSDRDRTINVEKKFEELLIQLLFHQLNRDYSGKTILKEVEENLSEEQEIDSFEWQIEETAFLDTAIEYLQKQKIKYEEFDWFLNEQLNNSGVICRKIEVGTYG